MSLRILLMCLQPSVLLVEENVASVSHPIIMDWVDNFENTFGILRCTRICFSLTMKSFLFFYSFAFYYSYSIESILFPFFGGSPRDFTLTFRGGVPSWLLESYKRRGNISPQWVPSQNIFCFLTSFQFSTVHISAINCLLHDNCRATSTFE